MPGLILINPPVAKPSEPPAGIARLAGFLTGHGLQSTLVDLNLEGMLCLLESARLSSHAAADTWSRRAVRHWQKNLSLIKERKVYTQSDQYRRAVADLDRA